MTWSDERLDDLARRVDDGFSRVDQDLRSLRAQSHEDLRSLRTEIGTRTDAMSSSIDAMGSRFDAMSSSIDAMGSRIDAMGSRIDSAGSRIDSVSAGVQALQRTMLQVGGGMVAAFLAGFIALIAAQV